MSSGVWKNKSDFGVNDLYKHYKKLRKGKGLDFIPQSLFAKILKDYNKAICEKVVEEAYEFRLPFRLGFLRIRKHKNVVKLDEDGKLDTSNMHPDWKATWDLWKRKPEAREAKKLIFHRNKHTNGCYFKYYWDKRTCNIKNSSVYKLEMSRTNKRAITTAINTKENIDYYE